jgi:hypothetical protein
MKVIARPMGTGKTEELLRSAAKDKALVLAENKAELQAKANAYGITVQVVDWDDIVSTDYGPEVPLYIHRMDDVIKHYFEEDYGLNLKGYSIRMEN